MTSRRPHPGVDRIAVALDHSEHALAAASMAASLARACGHPLVLLHVFEGHPEELSELDALSERFQDRIRMPTDALQEAMSAGSRKLFNRVREHLDLDSLAPEEVSLDGDPAEALLDYCRQHPDTLLIVGRRGLSPTRSILMGSVSTRLVHEAACPVLVHH
ncbi:universal stress protein [Natronospira bacteriovora]|uniref:Universal stress protein n=1 Tax=Natronospira bacteriovora TaxID=3069753 RepID=A0ABU0W3P7_9GAMM|nr:universal stress protein [Natronospira sp. AB-CW4]MDQ2068579.1 universal stress protein [Natronospira sp. AB-CW4]